MIPMYNTELFCQVYPEYENFADAAVACPFPLSEITTDNLQLTYYLLMARYGNTPIANLSVSQFELKLFATIFEMCFFCHCEAMKSPWQFIAVQTAETVLSRT